MKLVILLATIACAFTVHANEAESAKTEVTAAAEHAATEGHAMKKEMGKKAHMKMKKGHNKMKDMKKAAEAAATEPATEAAPTEETH